MRMHKNGIAFCTYKIEMGYEAPQAKKPRSQGSPQEVLVCLGERRRKITFFSEKDTHISFTLKRKVLSTTYGQQTYNNFHRLSTVLGSPRLAPTAKYKITSIYFFLLVNFRQKNIA